MQTNRNRFHYSLSGGALILAALPGLILPAIAAETAAAPTAAVAPAQTEAVVLTVLAQGGVKSDNPGVGLLEAGAIDSFETPKIEQDFVLRNDLKAPVTIGRLQPTCGCTSVILGEGTEATKTLAPGEEVKVRASVDVTRFHGPIHKAVRAYAADGTTLLATMEITATIQDPVTLSTRHVDFGRVNFGNAATSPLEVTLSPRLLAAGNLQLISSNPDITVAPDADKTPSAATNSRKYIVTISPQAAIGLVTGTLSFAVPPKPAAPQDATPTADAQAAQDRIASSLQMTQISVSAQVQGKISAMPAMIVIGTGKQAAQQITVTGATPAILKGLRVTSASPWVKLNPVAAPKKPVAGEALPQPASVVYEVTLNPKTPAGALEAQVSITANDGEHLIVPVLADVSPAPRPQ